MEQPSLHVELGKTVSFEELPPKSLALGSYCSNARIDTDDQCYAFKQDETSLRVAKPPVAQQLFDALGLGLNLDGYNVFVNQLTPDIILSIWIALNYQNEDSKVWLDHFLNHLTAILSYGSAYAATHADYIEELFFDQALKPYNEASDDDLTKTETVLSLLNACLENITKLSQGNMGTWVGATPYSRNFRITHKGSGWVMVESDQLDFRPIYDLGENRIVLYSQQPDGSYAYQLDKKSEYVANFPIGPETEEGTILNALNTLEPGWGGGDTIGGAPRNGDGSRSLLPPETVFDVVETIVQGKPYDRTPHVIL